MRRRISTFPLYILTITGHWPSSKASRLALSHDFKWTLGSQRVLFPLSEGCPQKEPFLQIFLSDNATDFTGHFLKEKGQPNYLLSDSSCQFPNLKLSVPYSRTLREAPCRVLLQESLPSQRLLSKDDMFAILVCSLSIFPTSRKPRKQMQDSSNAGSYGQFSDFSATASPKHTSWAATRSRAQIQRWDGEDKLTTAQNMTRTVIHSFTIYSCL